MKKSCECGNKQIYKIIDNVELINGKEVKRNKEPICYQDYAELLNEQYKEDKK